MNNNTLKNAWEKHAFHTYEAPSATSKRFYPPRTRNKIDISENKPERPLRICVITSIRSVGVGDLVNTWLRKDDVSSFIKGSLHTLITASTDELDNIVELAGVIIDDINDHDNLVYDKNPIGPEIEYTILPERDKQWITPYKRISPFLNEDRVVNIPSDFRTVSIAEKTKRRESKRDFEKQVAEQAAAWGADIILSDRCMVIFEELHRSKEFAGRVINIHPGITWAKDRERTPGATPIEDSLNAFADRRLTYTGATLHFVNDIPGGGEPVFASKSTQILLTDSPAGLRLKNYQSAKNPVLLHGLMHLAKNFSVLVRGNLRAQGLNSNLLPRSFSKEIS